MRRVRLRCSGLSRYCYVGVLLFCYYSGVFRCSAGVLCSVVSCSGVSGFIVCPKEGNMQIQLIEIKCRTLRSTLDYPDFPFFIFKVHDAFMEEKYNPVEKVVIDEKGLFSKIYFLLAFLLLYSIK